MIIDAGQGSNLWEPLGHHGFVSLFSFRSTMYVVTTNSLRLDIASPKIIQYLIVMETSDARLSTFKTLFFSSSLYYALHNNEFNHLFLGFLLGQPWSSVLFTHNIAQQQFFCMLSQKYQNCFIALVIW